MKVLGISASQRKWGNSDILVHHVLKGAKAEGAETKFQRLTDLDIGQCRGCFSCMIKGCDCVTNDQFPELLSAMRWADGVVLCSPIYIFCAAGSVQNMIPRFFHIGYSGEMEGKLGLAIAAGGGPGAEAFALPQVSMLFHYLSMPVIDQFRGYGQGPGEVFDDKSACNRAIESGAAMARGEKTFRGESGACPVCHFDLVVTHTDGNADCILCGLQGRWLDEGKEKRFEPLPEARVHWGAEQMRRHFEEAVLPSGLRFRERMKELREKVRQFRETLE